MTTRAAYTKAKKQLMELYAKRTISPYLWGQWEKTKKKVEKMEKSLMGTMPTIFEQQ